MAAVYDGDSEAVVEVLRTDCRVLATAQW